MYKSAIHPGQVLSIPRYIPDDMIYKIVKALLNKKASTKVTTSSAKERVRSKIQ